MTENVQANQQKIKKLNEQNRDLRQQLKVANELIQENETLKFQIKVSNELLSKQHKKLEDNQQFLRSAQNALIQKSAQIDDMKIRYQPANTKDWQLEFANRKIQLIAKKLTDTQAELHHVQWQLIDQECMVAQLQDHLDECWDEILSNQQTKYEQYDDEPENGYSINWQFENNNAND